MPDKEEIREEMKEVIDTYTDDGCLYLGENCVWRSQQGYCASDNDSYTCLMKRFDGLGVKIIDEGELPGTDEVLVGVLQSLYDRLDIDEDLAEIKAIGYVLDMLNQGGRKFVDLEGE